MEGDKSKYVIVFFFFFSFYDCSSWQVISPFSLTRCRPGISGLTSKNWNKTKNKKVLIVSRVCAALLALARQAESQRHNKPSETGPVACGKRREAEGRQVGG